MRRMTISRRIRLILLTILLATGLFMTFRGMAVDPVDVYVIKIHGTIDYGMSAFVRRSLIEAEATNTSIVVLDIETFGGNLDAALEIRDAVIFSRLPTLAHVQNRAHSAGALIALSAEYLSIASGGTIGSAEPRFAGLATGPADVKTISAVRGEFESTARRRGRDERLAGAMVDQSVEVAGIVARGDLLNVGGEKAVSYGLADMVANDWKEALSKLDMAAVSERFAEISVAERAAGLVTGSPVFSTVLLVVGIVGFIVELMTPGIGVPAGIGAVAFALFFGGRFIAGFAGWESLILVTMGLILLLVEALVIPGFGIAGLSGIGLIFVGTGMTFSSWQEAVTVMSIATVASAVILIFIGRRLSKSLFFGRLILDTSEGRAHGYVSARRRDELVGEIGETVTALRPAGTMKIGEERVDVISEGGFIGKGVMVKVVGVSGGRVVVREYQAKE